MMRPIRLAQVALEAESLRLHHQVRRTAIRAVLAVLAVALLLLAAIFLHIAAWFWLRQMLAPHLVGLIFAGADLIVAIVLGVIAARSGPGRIEREALAVRRRALEDAAVSLSFSALLARLVALFFRSPGKRP